MINPAEMNRVHYYRDIVLEGPTPEEEAIIELQDDVEDLRREVEALNGEIDALNTEIDILTNPSYIFIGDSYSEGYTPDSATPNESWSTKVCDVLEIAAEDRHIYDDAGAGFLSYGPNEKTFSDLLDDAYDDITDRSSITDIVVGGGYNDLTWEATNLAPAVESFVLHAKSLFGANVRVHIFPIGWAIDTTERYLLHNAYSNSYTQATRCGGKYHSYIYACLNREDAFSSDGIHPSAFGQQLIANEILNSLAGACDLEYGLLATKIGADDIMRTSLTNDLVMLGFNGYQKTVASIANGDNDLGLVTGGYILGWTGLGHKYGTFVTFGGGFYPCEMYFKRQSDGVHLIFTWDGAAIESSTTIYLHGQTWTTNVVYA